MFWRTADLSPTKIKTQLPNSYLFRFLQVRHAFQMQFWEMRVESLPSSLESLLSSEELTKPLSVSYKEFFKNTPQAVVRCREKWVAEIPDVQGEDWDEVWAQPFKHLVSARDRLIQLKFLHRSYYTPARLAKIFPNASAECWRCSHSPADTDHIFWQCQQVQRFWSDVTSCISELLTVPIPMTVKVCLLGLVDEVVPSRALRTMLNILLFYERKAILLHWKKPGAPRVAFWKGLVNAMLPYYKSTYEAGGCMKKFYKVWHTWYKSSNTVG